MSAADFHLYLASASPRRAALLTQIGVRYRRLPVSLDEAPLADETPDELARRLALAKARAGLALRPADHPVLGADTLIELDGQALGKPVDAAEGQAMLLRLSARSHQVHSAVALCDGRREALALVTTEVRLRALDPAECAAYWASGEPRDKAGGYAIQGLGAVFVEQIHGSCSGVIGLPLCATARLLADFGLAPLRHPSAGRSPPPAPHP